MCSTGLNEHPRSPLHSSDGESSQDSAPYWFCSKVASDNPVITQMTWESSRLSLRYLAHSTDGNDLIQSKEETSEIIHSITCIGAGAMGLSLYS